MVGCDLRSVVLRSGGESRLVTGFDETFAQTVHARSSYRADELVYGARFVSMFEHDEHDGLLSVDLARIHEVLSTPLSGDAES